MRKLFIYIFFLLPVLATVSCKKDGPKLTLDTNTAFSASLKASADNIGLSPSNDADTVLTLTWPAVSYGTGVAVTYTLELDTQTDTAGPGGWAKAQKFVAGNNVLRYSFAGKDLNAMLGAMGIFSASPVVWRVLSDVSQYNGSASTIQTIHSAAITVNITPYILNLFVPGAYQGWDPASAPLLNPVPGKAGLFEGYYDLAGSGDQHFKLTNAPDWNHTNYGDGGSGTLSTDGLAGDLVVPSSGYYELTANLNNNTWTAVKTTWGILGDASPGGWDTDTQLAYDAANQVWTATAVMKQAGSFKFRANNAWVIDFGIDGDGNLQYADNPFFPYNPNLNNLSVPVDGTYKITLDLHISGKYTYSLVKQ